MRNGDIAGDKEEGKGIGPDIVGERESLMLCRDVVLEGATKGKGIG